MKLLAKSELVVEPKLLLNEIKIEIGAGAFLIEGGTGRNDKSIKVFYYRPKKFNDASKILLVIPGAGRNGDSYRDAWIERAEQYNVLILAPMYSEKEYAFEDYHLCALIYDLNLKDCVEYVEDSNVARLDESKFSYKINSDKAQWIFHDFDRIFDLAVHATQSSQTQYDIFGHSAGGQILHRMALFHPVSKANNILAGNSGFFTLPSSDFDLPFGLKNVPEEALDLKQSFHNKLVLLLGELDNETEKGGTLLRSTSADAQGLHRLERGNFFYNRSKEKATELKTDFNWEMHIVPGVGHNHRKMGQYAATYLYEK